MPHGAHIEVIEASRRFSETGSVLERFNLQIQPGEFVSLLGPSGCGKSTVLRLIAGLDQPQSGEVKVSVQTSDGSPSGAFRGFVFQEAQLLPWKTALGNTELPLELMKVPRSEIKNKALAALRQVGLTEAQNKYPAQLSGGMKMRVSVARALVTEPRLLLLDEPFAALDENTRHRLQEDLRALWLKSRMTIVFVTHSASEAAFLSDRAVVLGLRPARVVLNRPSALPLMRDRALRTSGEYLREVEMLSSAFPDQEF